MIIPLAFDQILYVDSIVITIASTALRNIIGKLCKGWINILNIVLTFSTINQDHMTEDYTDG